MVWILGLVHELEMQLVYVESHWLGVLLFSLQT